MPHIDNVSLIPGGLSFRVWDRREREYREHQILPASFALLEPLWTLPVAIASDYSLGDFLHLLEALDSEAHEILSTLLGASTALACEELRSLPFAKSDTQRLEVGWVSVPAPEDAPYEHLVRPALCGYPSARAAGTLTRGTGIALDARLSLGDWTRGVGIHTSAAIRLCDVFAGLTRAFGDASAMGSLITLGPAGLTSTSGESSPFPLSDLDALTRFFARPVTLAEGLVYGDLYRMLSALGPDEISRLELLLQNEIAPLLAESTREPDPDKEATTEVLEIYPAAHDMKYDVLDPDYILGFEFHGYGPWAEPYEGCWAEYPDTPREGGISIAMCSTFDLVHLPLRYNPQLVFRDLETYEPLYETSVGATLYDVLRSIFEEVTFYGAPGDRNANRQHLKAQIERLKEDDSEREGWHSLEELMGQHDEEFGEGVDFDDLEDGEDWKRG